MTVLASNQYSSISHTLSMVYILPLIIVPVKRLSSLVPYSTIIYSSSFVFHSPDRYIMYRDGAIPIPYNRVAFEIPIAIA